MKKTLLTILLLAFVLVAPAEARDKHFAPAIGDINADLPGLERAVVSDDGQLYVYSNTGDLLQGYPVSVPNSVFITSPIMADITGSLLQEVIVVARRDDNRYVMVTYNGTGQGALMSLLPFPVFHDPIAVPAVDGDKQDIVFYDDDNILRRTYFNKGNPHVIADFEADLGGAIAASVDGEEIYITHANRNRIRVFARVGNTWRQSRADIPFGPTPAIYPVVEGPADYLYGVNRDGNIQAVHKHTGAVKAGFPVVLSHMPIGPLTLSDVTDAHAGPELLAHLSNGETQVVSRTGALVERVGDQQFINQSLSVDDPAAGTFFQGIRRSTHGLITNVGQSISSILSRIRNVLVQRTPEIIVTRAGQEIASGTAHAFGAVSLGESQSLTIVLENEGSGDLVLDGNDPVQILNDAAGVFAVATQPERIIAPGGNTSFEVSFTPNGQQNFSAVIRFTHNDGDETPFTIDVSGSGVNNLVQDGSMEAAGVDAWRSYGNPPTKEKSNEAFAGLQSMHLNTINSGGGIQQLDIPVEAGQWYRYAFRYHLDGGEIRSVLGINTSNSDFEGNTMILRDDTVDYAYHERVFQIPDDYVSGFRVVINTRDADVYLDDVVITPIEAPGLVQDGDMEAPHVAYWTRYGTPEVIEKRAEEGNQYLYVEDTNSGSGVQQTNIDVEPGQTYLVSFRYQFPEGNRLRPVMNLRSFGNNSDFERIYQNLPRTAPGEWKWYERQITIPEDNNDDLRIYWAMRTGAGVTAWFNIDDVAVRAVNPTLVLDGDMESAHIANWPSYGAPDVLEKRSEQGNRYLYLEETNGGAGAQHTNIAIEPGETYTLRFRYRFEQGERVRPVLNIRGIGGNNSDFEGIYHNLQQTQNGEWAWYERQFTVPEGVTYPMRLFFAMRSGDNDTGIFHLDDVTLIPSVVEFVRDGDMESAHTAAWIDYGPIDVKRKDNDAHAGNQSLYIERNLNYENSLGAQQVGLPVEPGQEYRLSFWYKGDTTFIPRLGNGESNSDYESSVTYLYPPGDEWQRYERTFTTPQDIREFRLVLVVDRFYYNLDQGPHTEIFVDADGNVFVDNVQVQLGADDVETLQPDTAFVRVDDIVIEPVN